MAHAAPATSYDDVPYPTLCYTQSHPDRLATCGRLLGLTSAPVERCRVLELGCASGGNLLPMAASLRDSQFVGIDLSPHQVEQATLAVTTLGLTNVAFFAMDIRDVTPAMGTFDYVIAHGVYSWVPPDVRDCLLTVCARNLAPHGIAYVSYNTFPGWHMYQGLREMMLYHVRGETDPHRRAAGARALIRFLGEAMDDERNQAYGTLIDAYRELLDQQLHDDRTQSDAALLHDELAENNDPVYFHQFVDHAASHGLQYLIDTDVPLSVPANLSPEAFEALRAMSHSAIEAEQYMDFLRNRAFRRSLLCHATLPVDRTLRPSRIADLAVATRASRAEGAGVDSDEARYMSPDGIAFQTSDPYVIAAFDHLISRAPQALPFTELLAAAAARSLPSGAPVDADVHRLAADLLEGFTHSVSLVELHAWVPPFVSTVSERPVAAPYARYQARLGPRVANQRHERVLLDSLGRYLLPLLDGEHALSDLGGALDDRAARGLVRVQGEREDMADPHTLRERLRDELAHTLTWLASAGLLIA
jgi:methyltransferase-like protein/SAM-dependent methyltransferase